ncbi:hypothetical protein C8J57DRAFT_437209 [Mycena rebaudengoi]|nr:hypothetical protein C8J57DRAFT_437209 [Mycena rebaudengoi]
MGLDNVQMDGRLQPSLTSSPCNSTLKDSTVDYPDHDCLNSLEDIPDSIETAYLEQLQQTALGEQNIAVNEQNRCILPLTRTRFHSPIKGGITIRPASTQDRVLQYGVVACSLLKDIGNANNQPYLQAIASISLLIMETAQRVKKNKAVTRMTERVYELVCAVINICRDSEADLAPAMIRSIEQFSETLEKILTFVRSQVKGGFWRRVFRSMEVADLITDCNTGLKYALDHFGFQSGIIAPVTMSEIQRDASKRHDELVAILHEKKNRPKRSSPKRPPPQLNTRSAISGIPAPPEIFHGREEEVSRVVNTILHSKSARIAIVGPDGVGKTAIVLVASHDPEVCKLFGQNRFFVDCTPAADGKQLISLIANQLGIALESGPGRKPIIKHLTAISTAETPVLIILDAIGEAWTPYENRNDVEDFLSLLADLEHVTLIVTLCGDERPRQVRWTRPLLHTLSPLTSSAARDTFLDISDVTPDEPGLDELLAITENLPGAITRIAGLAAFEGCMSLIAHWKKNGPARLDEKDFLPSYNRLVEETAVWGASVNSELVSH